MQNSLLLKKTPISINIIRNPLTYRLTPIPTRIGDTVIAGQKLQKLPPIKPIPKNSSIMNHFIGLKADYIFSFGVIPLIKTSEVVSLLLYTTLEVYTNFRIDSIQITAVLIIRFLDLILLFSPLCIGSESASPRTLQGVF